MKFLYFYERAHVFAYDIFEIQFFGTCSIRMASLGRNLFAALFFFVSSFRAGFFIHPSRDPDDSSLSLSQLCVFISLLVGSTKKKKRTAEREME
jgi:hypothetical protein